MPPAKKRKITDGSKVQEDAVLNDTAARKSPDPQHTEEEVEVESPGDTKPEASSVDKNQERRERFKALQARAVSLHCPTIPICQALIFCVAKLRPEESQRSSRRIPATSDRP